jgi:hypothetical protein
MKESVKQTIMSVLNENRSWVLKKCGEGKECGWCGISAARINACLKQIGMNPTLVLVDTPLGSHCFNELNGFVIDVTAVQFKYEAEFEIDPIVFERKKTVDEKKKRWWWGWVEKKGRRRTYRKFFNGEAMDQMSWWNEQSPQRAFKRSHEILSVIMSLPKGKKEKIVKPRELQIPGIDDCDYLYCISRRCGSTSSISLKDTPGLTVYLRVHEIDGRFYCAGTIDNEQEGYVEDLSVKQGPYCNNQAALIDNLPDMKKEFTNRGYSFSYCFKTRKIVNRERRRLSKTKGGN